MRNIQPFKEPWLLLIFLFLPGFGFAQVTQEWVARYNGPGNNYDDAQVVAVDGSGNVYVTGSSTGIGTGLDYATIKYNAAGVQQWEARYNGPGNSSDVAIALAVDASGNVFVTGSSAGIGTGDDYTTIKYNAAGVQQWEARYNGPGNDFDLAASMAVDAFGNIYVTGQSLGSGTGSDYATVKYNSAGVQQWVARYSSVGNFSDAAKSLAVDAAGNVLVTGISENVGDLGDYTTIKYDANGNEQWVAIYNGPGNNFDVAQSLAVDALGNVYITGASTGSGTGLDYATVKYNSNGIEQWVARFDGPGTQSDFAFDLAVDVSGNTYVTGQISVGTEDEDFDYATIKYNAAGIQQWVTTYNGPGNAFDGASTLALDGSANVYITGRSAGSGTGFDFATIKYNTNGEQQWEARYNGAGNVHDIANSLAIDTFNNVYVTGRGGLFGVGTDFDYITIKYSQTLLACGNKNDKVLVCHKGKTKCINASAVEAHLGHGDQLGACATPTGTITAREELSAAGSNTMPANFKVNVIPNPAATTTKLFYELPFDGRVSIAVFDILGRRITTLVDASKPAGFHNAEFNVWALQNGLYYCRIMVKTKNTVWVQTRKISVVK
jgi:hypothetical protein